MTITLADPTPMEPGTTPYKELHRHMNRTYPRTGRCERCGVERYTHLAIARLDGYTTDRDDWLELCVPCHQRFDGHVGPNPRKVKRGVANGRAKLTEDAVRQIRARYAAGGISQPQLGREYGVTHILIGKIVRRELWKAVA